MADQNSSIIIIQLATDVLLDAAAHSDHGLLSKCDIRPRLAEITCVD
jgi:hypothetical protein